MGSISAISHVKPGDGFVSEAYSVEIPCNKEPLEVLCCWKLSSASRTSANHVQYFHCIDLVLKIVSGHHNEDIISVPIASGTPLGNLIHECYNTVVSDQENEILVKAIGVPLSGFLCRTDILELRMKHCEFVNSVVRFSAPNDYFPQVIPDLETSLATLLFSCPGALLARNSSKPPLETLTLLERAVEGRLSFDWVLPSKPPPRNVCVIGGRQLLDPNTGSYGSQGPFEAAHSLGISVSVIDRPGHFLENEMYSHLRDDFIALDMSNDSELPQMMAEALKDRKIDGVVTFSDEYVIATSRLAELLGLPTEPVHSIMQAHYKDKMRQLLGYESMEVIRLENTEHATYTLHEDKLNTLHYPLIVKPCRGAASRGVKKVQDIASLHQAIRQMEKDGLAKHGVLIETYVDGPEVDANIVLWDGEMLFADITDDFPCEADEDNATISDGFRETIMVSPSGLRHEEHEILKSSLHQSLLKMGFRCGVFHVEARVRNSSMRYQEKNKIMDLVERAETTGECVSPDVFLIEVNVRPPGLDCAWATLYTYGVDLCALQFLQAIRTQEGERQRFAALSRPFSTPQYWCGNCQIPVHRDNVFVPVGFIDLVLEKIPDVVPHISRAEMFKVPGTTVSPQFGVEFLAYFLVYSRIDRRQVLEIYSRLLEAARAVLDEA